MFKGSIVALVTPFRNGKVDEQALEKLVEFHIANGTDAIISCGTTGESATLSHEEDIFVTKRVVDIVKKRIPVIAGAGSNNFCESLCLAEAAKANGADGILVVTPYYNKPTQEGMFQHFSKLADNVNIPMILYNVPGRTGVNLSPDTVLRLAKIPNIVALKDASGSLSHIMETLYQNPAFTVLSGDDALTYAMMALGAKGVISVAANVIPKETADMCRYMLDGKFDEAKKIHFKYYQLFNGLFFESNPIPVKAALNMMGMIGEEIRLPLTPMSAEPKEKLRKIMKEVGLV